MQWPTKDPGETFVVDFDYSQMSGVGTLTGTPVVTVTMTYGIDSNPSAILSGAAYLNGNIVYQVVQGGQSGCIYHLSCSATDNNGMTFVVSADLPVIVE